MSTIRGIHHRYKITCCRADAYSTLLPIHHNAGRRDGIRPVALIAIIVVCFIAGTRVTPAGGRRSQSRRRRAKLLQQSPCAGEPDADCVCPSLCDEYLVETASVHCLRYAAKRSPACVLPQLFIFFRSVVRVIDGQQCEYPSDAGPSLRRSSSLCSRCSAGFVS